MKLKHAIFLAFLGIFILSCSEIRKRRAKESDPELKPFLFKTSYFIGGDDLNYSFPMWFNDSIIKENKIKTITHRWYSGSAEDESDANVYRLRRYSFNETGNLLRVQQKRFYENTVVENITFEYKGIPDKMGYTDLTTTDSLNLESPVEYTTYSKEVYHKKFVVYQNDNTGDFLFCVLNKKLQGIVSVDSLFAPTPDDIIQYGFPYKPYKRYQIENFVKEKNVVRYRYFDSSELAYRKSEKYPFSNKTYATVAKDGTCTGFVDSTFSAEEYLNRTVSTFSYSEGKLPTKLTHNGMRQGNFETFEYSFFE